jgi:hypothetical protein
MQATGMPFFRHYVATTVRFAAPERAARLLYSLDAGDGWHAALDRTLDELAPAA